MTTQAAEREYLAAHRREMYGKPIAVFNPNGAQDLPKIYAFSNVGGGDGIAYAMAADGTVLGSHWCSNEGYVPCDLGVLEGSRPDRHEGYRKHYPDGYEMEFISARDIKSHPGLMQAYLLNQQAATRSEESQS